MAQTNGTDLATTVEAETLRIGQYLWDHLARRKPSIFEKRWWDDRILAWAMSDEAVKLQMFRFVDVLPMLRSHESVTRHLREYFEDVKRHLPGAVRLVVEHSEPNSVMGRALALGARSNARRMAERFIAGRSVDEVLDAVRQVRRQGLAFTLDLLGESVIGEDEADAYQQAYLDLVSALAPQINQWPEIPQIDCDHRGPIPRVNVSLKLSALYSQFAPVGAAGTATAVKRRLRPLLCCVRDNGAFLHVDMEHAAYKDLTLDVFKQILLEDEFRDFADVGIVIQAYLPSAERDLQELLDWAKRRGTSVCVRLVKGAYWDYETVVAQAHGWPVPVYQQKWKSDASFERHTRFLMEHHEWLRPALASHNLRSLAHGLACAKTQQVPTAAHEIQMLYGMADDESQLFAEMGYRVRVYTPFGDLIPGMAYLVRRLLENTSNDSFLRRSFAEGISVEELMMKPVDENTVDKNLVDENREKQPSTGAEPCPPAASTSAGTPDRFRNEPLSDFSRAETREAMQEAIEHVGSQLGVEYPLIIDGRPVETRARIVSLNPSHKAQTVGVVAAASPDDAVDAIQAARRAFPQWSRVKLEYRAEYLELVASEMRERRFELAAWEIHECGKPWAEADADVAEAIDFCLYYAEQMRRLAVPRHRDLPGEENRYFYRPRGVAVVIAPWNFPLAILTGMTAAALVAGNTVVMKPAEQSSVVAAKLMEIMQDVELPAGVVNYLPGAGEDVGPELVGSPDIDLIAFTGSRPVGLSINERAATTDTRQAGVRRVIAEMGGKNAIIVDDDADLDEAVRGVVQSAFGYSGQKCSACSRAIVLDGVYSTFLKRLIDATASLTLGPAELPGTTVGPVIDKEAFETIHESIEMGKEDSTLAWASAVGDLIGEGYYVGPHIFTDVDPASPLAREEIFGPVVAVMRAKDMDEALRIANGTDYALTGGIYSRSPAHLERARQEFLVGNLYLNRGITGAMVDRQPFGGFKMSGIGSKAGGPDYLQQFLIPVNVCQNTMRRGFAPPPGGDD